MMDGFSVMIALYILATMAVFTGLFFSVTCAVIASDKGRSGFTWFFVGLFFNIFGLLAVACMVNLNKKNIIVLPATPDPSLAI